MPARRLRSILLTAVLVGTAAAAWADPEAAPAPAREPDAATKAVLAEIDRAAAARKAERAEMLRLRKEVARNARPARRPPGFAGILTPQQIQQQRRLNAAFNRNPAGVVGRLLNPVPVVPNAAPPAPVLPAAARPAPPQIQVFEGPNGGGFVMFWKF